MSTPHNAAQPGDFARAVLMPGDPLRARYIAEHFLEQPRLISDIRNIYAYTGSWQGRPVSVMASGMGMPSIGIYSYELFTHFGVEAIIRVGSTGSIVPELHLFDIVLATSSYSESTFARTQNGDESPVQYPSPALTASLRAAGRELGIPLHEGCVHSTDVFYAETANPEVAARRCLCEEMESFALFHNARATGKQAACLLTVSDDLITHQAITREARERSFEDMMKVALAAAVRV